MQASKKQMDKLLPGIRFGCLATGAIVETVVCMENTPCPIWNVENWILCEKGFKGPVYNIITVAVSFAIITNLYLHTERIHF